MRIIGYERVSTARQGASGLGIEAQRQAIDGFVAQRSGDADRPLHRGGERAQPGPAGARQGAAPRQGHRRDAGHRQARPAVAQRRLPADAPGQRGAVRRRGPAGGERPDRRASWRWWRRQEREAISRRTKEALAVARSRGVRLGNPNGAAALRRAGKGGAPLRAAIARNADRHARDLAPVVEDIRAWRRDQPPGDRGGAERPRDAHPPRRALARFHGDEPARPARAQGGKRRRPLGDRRMTLVVRLLEDGDQGLLGRVAPEVFDHDVDPAVGRRFPARSAAPPRRGHCR